MPSSMCFWAEKSAMAEYCNDNTEIDLKLIASRNRLAANPQTNCVSAINTFTPAAFQLHVKTPTYGGLNGGFTVRATPALGPKRPPAGWSALTGTMVNDLQCSYTVRLAVQRLAL